MLCKMCNTRVDRRSAHCPNCGGAISAGRERAPARLPRTEVSTDADEIELETDVALEAIGAVEVSEEDSDETKPDVPWRPPLRAEDANLSSLREMLAARPDSLESGLTIHCDDSGEPVGVGYSSGAGEIDLLARDGDGGFLVVTIAAAHRGEEAVREILQRIGWVRKHMASRGQRVRGTVLFEREPGDLSYLAAAVADTVAFKTCRIALTFDDLEL